MLAGKGGYVQREYTGADDERGRGAIRQVHGVRKKHRAMECRLVYVLYRMMPCRMGTRLERRSDIQASWVKAIWVRERSNLCAETGYGREDLRHTRRGNWSIDSISITIIVIDNRISPAEQCSG